MKARRTRLRLKRDPQDFVVREATSLRIRREPGPYQVYLLEKEGWNTVDALMRIAKASGLPYKAFSYGGKKDRHAVTAQYITVEGSRRDLSTQQKGYKLTRLGYANEPMAPSQILHNSFQLTVRELTEAEATQMVARAKTLKAIPNWFDDQRFGNMDRERGFVVEKLLQGRAAEALNLALTTVWSEESREAKERKRQMREAWGDWPTLQGLAETAFERRCFDLMLADPNNAKKALATSHPEQIGLWISTYQSFLWNEVLRRWLIRRGWVGAVAPGVAGELLYLDPTVAVDLRTIIPMPGQGMRFPVPETGLILEEILRERRLRPAALEGEVLPGHAIRSFPREAFIRPEGLHVGAPEPDEHYPGKQKLTLRFILPRGAYATNLIKALSAADA
jgi:tRNA pseudouridine13 synthase